MNASAEELALLFSAWLIVGCYALALLEWGLAPREDLPTLSVARRSGWIWSGAAVALLALMGTLLGIADRWRAAWDFLSGLGAMWVLQAVALGVLIRAGAYWAQQVNGRPFALMGAPWRRWPWKTLGRLLALMLLWTAIWIWLTPEGATRGGEWPERLGLNRLSPFYQWPFVIALLSLAPILEECLFRHYLMYRLAHRFRGGAHPMWIGIVLSSLAWSIGHWGLVDPWWLKFNQTFGLGLILGWSSWRLGLDAAIALHWSFNLLLLLLFTS